MGIKQHLVGLEHIGSHDKGSAVAELGVGHLKLDALPSDLRPVLAPVELEGLSGIKGQRNEHAPSGRVLFAQTLLFPTAVRTIEAQSHEISVDLLDGALLFARLAALRPQPC